MAHRRSAPPTSQRSLRDSVGSLDYLSESQVDLDSDDEEAQSEVGVVLQFLCCKVTCTMCVIFL